MPSSYVSITLYRSRTGALMAYSEDSAGRGKPVVLAERHVTDVLWLAAACGADLPAMSTEHCMPSDELAERSAELVKQLKGGR